MLLQRRKLSEALVALVTLKYRTGVSQGLDLLFEVDNETEKRAASLSCDNFAAEISMGDSICVLTRHMVG